MFSWLKVFYNKIKVWQTYSAETNTSWLYGFPTSFQLLFLSVECFLSITVSCLLWMIFCRFVMHVGSIFFVFLSVYASFWFFVNFIFITIDLKQEIIFNLQMILKYTFFRVKFRRVIFDGYLFKMLWLCYTLLIS